MSVKCEHKSCKDLAAFEVTMFIAPHGKQPLQKNWHAKGTPVTHKMVMFNFLSLR